MSTLIKQKNFEEIYNKTYYQVLKYIVCKCQNLEDVNEILQDTYVELYQTLKNKKNIKVKEEPSYIIGIAKNIVKNYYKNKYKEKSNIIYFSKDIEDNETQIPSEIDLEANIINKENIETIWNYLNNKNVLIAKIFYLYYALGLKISEISEELKINESTVKNYIYRTLKELNKKFGKEVN